MHLQVGGQRLGGLGHEGPDKLDVGRQGARPLHRKVEVEQVHDAPPQRSPRAQVNAVLHAQRQVHTPAIKTAPHMSCPASWLPQDRDANRTCSNCRLQLEMRACTVMVKGPPAIKGDFHHRTRRRAAPVEGEPVDEPHNGIGDDILHSLCKVHLVGEPRAHLHGAHGLL